MMALSVKEAGDIYRRNYWAAINADALPPGLAIALFDFAVNSGPARAAKTLQALLGVAADGAIGPMTIAAIRRLPQDDLIRRLLAARRAFLRRLSTFPVFGRGWMRRVASVEALALAEARKAAPRLAPALSTIAVSPPEPKERSMLTDTKSILSSRTIWANAIGLIAFGLTLLGVDSSGIDQGKLVDALLAVLTGGSFIASMLFRIMATHR